MRTKSMPRSSPSPPARANTASSPSGASSFNRRTLSGLRASITASAPRPPGPSPREAGPRADAGGVGGDGDVGGAGLGDGEAMGREYGRRAEPIDRGGLHRWWDR